ncbi:MAG TPA: polysaccharide deacetylase family protein, partial [Flavobacteriales bacterium]|nr:polysaccharide deacetylase family protein [Flavobacteriales bacterium]
HPEHTPALLDLLRAEQVQATFFCIGREVERYPAIAKRIVDEGHAIGIHTQDHRWTWGFQRAVEARQQIDRCVEAISAATGVVPVLFRPPFGATSPDTAAAMTHSSVLPIAWDLRTFDTLYKDAASVMRRIDARLPSSTIVLLHDTHPFTVELTRAILDRCRERGTRLVKVTADP